MIDQIANLSPERRKLLEALLKEKGVTMARPAGIPRRPAADSAPLSFAQQRLWFLDQFEPGSPQYNIPTAVRLSGALDVAALERSLAEVVRRHEALRTAFRRVNGEPVQVICPAAALEMPVVDLSQLPAAEREAAAMRQAREEAGRPFDLGAAPLIRATLLRLDPREHLILLTMHHIVSDGWSMGVLVREIGLLYSAFVAGQPSPLPKLPIQYADFAAWQREWLQGAGDHDESPLQRQIDYWRQRLTPLPPALELPTDRPRPAVQTANGASYSFSLPRDLAASLTALSQREGATLFMTLLAAFQVLLHRYSGQDDICVGSPIAGRTRAELEPLIGCFINTLVFRGDLSGNPGFRELLRQTRETAVGAYAHQDAPFELLVETLQPPRDTSHSPLFQVMFILQNVPPQARQLPGLAMSQVTAHSGTATFDLTLSMVEGPDGLRGDLEYNTDLFDEATIARMAGHFHTLLAAIAADADAPIGRLPLLTAAERRQILGEWNQTAKAYPAGRTLHQIVTEQAEKNPDAIAVTGWQVERLQVARLEGSPSPTYQSANLQPANLQPVTYGELDARANRLAHYLRKLGVGPETLVGISIPRSPEMAVGLLGILKAGGAYLPLDPGYPPERLRFMVEDAAPPVILTTKEIYDVRFTMYDLTSDSSIVHLDAQWPEIAQEPATDPGVEMSSDSLAYVIYTSGSTGTPKGVMITHGAAVNLSYAMADSFALTPADRVLQFSTISFDAAVEEIFCTWASGATLVLRPGDLPPTPAELLRLVEREQVTVLDFSTAYWHTLVAEIEQRRLSLPPCLRLVCVGGDAAAREALATWRRLAGPAVRWLNTYGPTETTVTATLYDPAGDQQPATGPFAPIGRPIPNYTAYILDRHMQPVPVGVPGELYIGGAGVARGYLNRPDLTADRFVDWGLGMLDVGLPDSGQSPIPNLTSRIYKTGDLARYRSDGCIEFLGRADNQVKIRGFRVEPGEIEAALMQHPAVREAVVLARADAAGEKRLVAYVVQEQRTENKEQRAPGPDSSLFPSATLRAGAVLCSTELRSFLKDRLPEFMLPAAFVTLDAWPLTPAGKIDRRALPAPEPAALAPERAAAPLRTPTEEVLAALWGRLLGAGIPGGDANFFDLGGHSLLATRLVARLHDAFGVELPVRAVFEAPTVAALAAQIDRARQSAAGALAPPITPAPRTGDLPLSFAQQRMWFLDQLEPNSPLYNIPDALRLTGDLDVAVVERCLTEIVRRHEVLRTTFPTVDGKPRQQIAPSGAAPPLAVPLIDLRQLPAAEREVAALRLVREEARRPFDLARGPLLRASLLRLADDEHIGLFTLHHIAADGWSSGILIAEMAALYQAFSSGQESPLPELAIQYADFAAWQRAWLRGEVMEQQLAYWRRQLDGIPPLLELPADRPRPAVQSYRGAHLSFTLPPQLAAGLKALSQREGATIFMTLLAAFQTLLHRYSGQDDICVGTPIAGRTRAEIEPLIGCFINTLVLRGNMAGNPSFRELLGRVRETALGAYAHQDVPFEMIVDALQPERNLGHTPLFQVMFILQNAPGQPLRLPGLTLAPLEAETGISNFDLTLVMAESDGGMVCGVEYSADLFDQATIERLIAHFERLLLEIVARPETPIGALPLLSEAERRLLAGWNATERPFAADRCIHQLFAEQAARTPDAIAIAGGQVDGLQVDGLQVDGLQVDGLQVDGLQVDRLQVDQLEGSERSNLQPATFQPANLQPLTYGELDALSNQLAHYLRRLGVGPETLVGICVERSPAMIVGLLGILKAGGAYLPLDPGYPPERLRFMVEDARPQVLLTMADVRLPMAEVFASEDQSAIGNRQSAIVYLDTDWEHIAQQPATDPGVEMSSDTLAYVIYTSGSTGQPKGVMVPHRAVVNHNQAVIDLFALSAADRMLQFATITFDAAVEEIFPTLLCGAALVLRPAGALPTASELLRLVAERGVTVLDLPTAYWHAWVAEMALGGLELPPGLRLVVVGGEAAGAAQLATWLRYGGDRLTWLNTYGPTEATVIASCYALRPGDPPPPADAPVPIGRPIANTQLYILDRHMQPAPIGVPGELYIGGAGVARGYLNRSDLTAERFIAWPTGDNPGLPSALRLYKTGDLARYRPDGVIEYLGRADDQVKLRGFRIELGEIAAALAGHPAVQEAAVVLREDAPGVKRLVAYVTVQDAGGGRRDAGGETREAADTSSIPPPASLPAQLREFLKERLPAYMVPAAFVELPALPLTPSGKINRRALPAPAAEPTAAAEQPAPVGAAEETLARIWAEVLGRTQVGIHDNFFALGGDSILSIQVIARANAAGLRLSPRQLFEHPTVAGLATVAGAAQAISAEQGVVVGPAPLTPIQQWFFAQELSAPHHWNQSVLLAVRQPLRRDLLERTLSALLEHHDALRLRFTRDATGWRQMFAAPDGKIPLTWVDLSGSTEQEQYAAISGRAAALQRSLSLAEGPLLRAAYFDLGPQRNGRLLLIIHHLAVDGVSWRILLEDVQTVYGQLAAGAPPRLPAKTTSFRQWAERLAEHAGSEVSRRELGYWLGTAASVPARLPVDFPGGDNSEAAARSLTVELTPEETRALLTEVPPVYRTEINDVLLTALVQALAPATGTHTLLVELEGHGREDLFDDIDISRTVGWFTTTFPVRLSLERAQGPGEALKAVKEQLRAVPRRGIGYGLLRYLSPDPAIAEQLESLRQPEISFNYLGQIGQDTPADAPFEPAPEPTGQDHDPTGARGHVLEINGGISGGQLRMEWTYSAELHRPATIERLAGAFSAALRALIAHCRTPEAGGYTPSDFGLAKLDQRKLDKVLGKIGKGRTKQ